MTSHGPQVEPPYEFIRDRLAEGKVIPFLGAGASLGVRPEGQKWTSPDAGFLPSAAELAEYLDRRSGFPPEASADLTRIAQFFDGVIGRAGLDEDLREIFAKQYRPAAIHYFLAQLPKGIIVTTNYDDLQERAFRDLDKRFHLVTYRAGDLTFLLKKHGAKEPEEVPANELSGHVSAEEIPVIYKMHGGWDPADENRDSYVITEDDYVEFLSRMASNTAIPSLFAEAFRRRHFLFLGYGLRDWNLRVILHQIWHKWRLEGRDRDRDRPVRNYASWAIQHRAPLLEQKFWERRSVTIYELTVDEFLRNLTKGPNDGPPAS